MWSAAIVPDALPTVEPTATLFGQLSLSRAGYVAVSCIANYIYTLIIQCTTRPKPDKICLMRVKTQCHTGANPWYDTVFL